MERLRRDLNNMNTGDDFHARFRSHGQLFRYPAAQNKWHHLYQLLLHVDHLPLESSEFIAFTLYLVVEIAHTGFLFPSDPG